MGSRSGGVDIPVVATWNNRALTQADRQIKSFSKGITKSFMGIGAGIGGALAFGAIASSLKDMGAAAAEDQKSVVSLAKAMQNVGAGAQNAQVEDFIKKLMLATGVADDQLRPAFQRLITATGDVAKSQALMQTAMDASAATGKDLESVTLAISKAANGNIGALTRMGVPIDAGIVKSKDFAAAIAVMNKRFGGQAATAAETYAGKLKRIDTAAGEAQETVGYSLLKAVDDVTASMGGTDGAVGAMTDFGDSVANVVYGVDQLILGINTLKGQTSTGFEWVGKVRTGVEWLANQSIPGLDSVMGTTTDVLSKLNAAGEVGKRQQAGLNEEIAKAVEIRNRYNTGTDRTVQGLDYETGAAGKAADAQKKHAAALDKVKAAFDRLNGKNISVAEARLNMRELKAGGPTATGERTVKTSKVNKDGSITYGTKVKKFVTRDDKLRYAIEVARGTNDLGSAIFDKGNGSPAAQARAAAAYAAGRKTILGTGLGAGVARDFLSTPRALTPAANAAAANVSSIVNNFIFNGGINAQTPEAAIVIAKKAARLSKLSGRHVNAGLG